MGGGDKDRFASLIALKPLIDDDGRPYLPLMDDFPFGQGLGVNQDSALVRPFHKALRDGKPFGTINYIFYMEGKQYYTLGSFAHSPGGKIIFFPGIIDSRIILTADDGEILSQGILHNIDHFSLESSLRVYHVTLKQKATDRSKYQRANTTRIKDDIVHWFSMGVRDTNVLEPAPKTQEIKLRWKDHADLKRKVKWIDESRGGCKFNVTSVDGQPRNEYYINFEFFVSATHHAKDAILDTGVYHVGLSSYPVGTDPRHGIMTRSHYVELKDYQGSIWVRVTKIIGKLKEHAVWIYR